MSNDLVVPGLAGGPSKYFDKKPIEKEEIGSGIGVGLGYSVISTSGKQFKLHHQGEDYLLLADDGKSPAQTFDFVILRGGKFPSHTWYKQQYDAKRTAPPDCQSTDGVAPDDDVPDFDPKTGLGKQSDLCQTCPQHEWKMQKNGREGRACTDSLRLVVFPGSQNMIERAIGRRIDEPILFRIPAASMKGLIEFMKQVKARWPHLAPYGYLTRAKMRQDVPHPQFTYVVADWLKDEVIAEMEQIREEPTAYRILGQAPDGSSLVRAAANINEVHHAVIGRVSDATTKQIVEAKAEEIEPQVPIDEAPVQQMKPIEDAPADMNALLAAMRPRPPAS
jgi:hypothetical protein